MKAFYKKVCPNCGVEFSTTKKFKKYCSLKCSDEADKKRRKEKYKPKPKVTYQKICPVCGKEFDTEKSTQIYCSLACKRTENQKAEKAAVVKKNCVICGKEFETNKPTLIVTCSKECSHIRHLQMCNLNKDKVQKVTLRQCPICGNEFVPYRQTQIFCSAKCKDAARNERKHKTLKNLRLEYKFRNEEYVEIHRDIFTELLRRIFNRKTKKNSAKKKPLDDWIREADICGLSYGYYRAAIEVFGKTFEELRQANETLRTEF